MGSLHVLSKKDFIVLNFVLNDFVSKYLSLSFRPPTSLACVGFNIVYGFLHQIITIRVRFCL